MGWLMARLQRADPAHFDPALDRAGHVRPLEPFRPSYATRAACRAELLALPNAVALAACEAGGPGVEPDEEPIAFV